MCYLILFLYFAFLANDFFLKFQQISLNLSNKCDRIVLIGLT